MMKFVIFGVIATVALAQRPSYAGTSSKGYPELASRFQDISESSSNSNGLANRIGEDSKTTTIPPNIPVDARGDVDLVNTLNTWPRENRPFWLLNADHIERHRDPEGTRTRPQQEQQEDQQEEQQEAQIVSRSSFEDHLYNAGYRPVRPSYLVYI